MKLLVAAIFDKAVGAYNTPLFFRQKMEAIRSFGDACRAEGSQFRNHAEDYVLMDIGEFDDATGVVSCHPGGPNPIVGALEFASADPITPVGAASFNRPG